MRHAAALGLLLLLSPLVAAGDATFVQTGTYLAGEPAGVLLADACTQRRLEGLNSNCFAIPPAFRGHNYVLRAKDDAKSIAALSVCFYMAGGAISVCDPPGGKIPSWAEEASVASLGGVNVRWTFVSA